MEVVGQRAGAEDQAQGNGGCDQPGDDGEVLNLVPPSSSCSVLEEPAGTHKTMTPMEEGAVQGLVTTAE